MNERRRDDNPDVRHDRARLISRAIGQFMWIRKLTSSAEISDRCTDGISKMVMLADNYGLQKEMDELRQREIDPMM